MKLRICVLLALLAGGNLAYGQNGYWQQRVDYTMNVHFDVTTHRYSGDQKLIYTNNSPDTLKKAYYHLYYNAFQPGSMMDVRNRTIADPSWKIGDKIMGLKPDEIGYLHVTSLTRDGRKVDYHTEGTILVVRFNEPILPGASAELKMKFDGQVPLQIRRSGRNSAEGIDYSMSQWFPKISEYDKDGWHPNPYVGREFYGVWGDYDVTITIDRNYVVAASGYLQNPNEVGYGYEDEGVTVNQEDRKTLTWHFKAPQVHDFMWAADPDYKHTRIQVPDGPVIHFFYQPGPETRDWELAPPLMSDAMEMASRIFGVYPYREFHMIQGGDGGMEYPMSTLMLGNRRLGSIIGTGIHEMMHCWYQGILGTDESQYAWMDEGFATYSSNLIVNLLLKQNKSNPQQGSYSSYFRNVRSGNEQSMLMHADHYQNNRAYSDNAYSKGAVFLHQLGYVIGQERLLLGMRRYFNDWKFKHPTPWDFIRIMEEISDMELDWYLEQFIYSTNTIDYGIDSVYEEGPGTTIELRKIGEMMMPIDLYIKRSDGTAEVHYIPLRIMHGEKENEYSQADFLVEEDWPWTHPTYRITVDIPLTDIETIIIDPSYRMADIDQLNNIYVKQQQVENK